MSTGAPAGGPGAGVLADPQVGIDVEQLAGCGSARQPGSSSIGSVAMTTAGRSARSPERTRTDPRAAGVVEVAGAAGAAGRALEHVQLVHVGIAQRPQLGCR